MSKALLIPIIVVILIGAAFGGIYFASKGQQNQLPSSSSNNSQNKENSDENSEEKIYEDESGFSFKYFSNYKVTDDTPDDETFYSLLNLASGKDSIKITIQDTKIKTAKEWVAQSESFNSASLIGAINLSGMSAQQYKMGESIFTIAIDKGVLYLIEGKNASAYDLVVSSFLFGKANEQPQQAQSSSSVRSDVVYEEEEVVE